MTGTAGGLAVLALTFHPSSVFRPILASSLQFVLGPSGSWVWLGFFEGPCLLLVAHPPPHPLKSIKF